MGINTSFWKKKKVFVTGHTGFKGGWLSLWLQSLDAEVFGYSLEPDLPENFYPDENSLVHTSGKDGVLVPGISIGRALLEEGRVKVKLFTNPHQISLVNIVLEQKMDLEAK